MDSWVVTKINANVNINIQVSFSVKLSLIFDIASLKINLNDKIKDYLQVLLLELFLKKIRR